MNELTQAQPGTVEWEARRVAAAFGVEAWKVEDHNFFPWVRFWSCEPLCEVRFLRDTGALSSMAIGGLYGVAHSCQMSIFNDGGLKKLWPHPAFNAPMARGLYCLGFSDQSILSQLPPLSAHEQMEARLTMPQEFWPQQWLDELAKSAAVE